MRSIQDMYLLLRAVCCRYLIPLLSVVFLCNSCVYEKRVPTPNYYEQQYSSSLPMELQSNSLRFEQLLAAFDILNSQQRGVVLEQFLKRKQISSEERAQASYMLARLYEQDIETGKDKPIDKSKKILTKSLCDQTIFLFNQAEIYSPLKIKSLWHISEVATISGEEKIVRQVLNEMLGQNIGSDETNAVQYALAQSYMRTDEIDKAFDLLKKIRTTFPHTDYALGAGYYLGTFAYTQLEQNNKAIKKQIYENMLLSGLVKAILAYYLEYLQLSPSGRFAEDTLAKLKSLESKHKVSFKENELAIIANAYFLNEQYTPALIYWKKANIDKHRFEIAQCLIKLGQVAAAQQSFFKGLEKYPHDKSSLPAALSISKQLNNTDAFKFWSRLHNTKFVYQDEVLWNMAIRAPLAPGLNFYQELLVHYPNSKYAVDAQWRILWQKYKASKGKALQAVANSCIFAANKYSNSQLAPRFLFWAGKIFEALSSKQQAAKYYAKATATFPHNYYGQRAKFRLLTIKSGAKDNYFEMSLPVSFERLSAKGWTWPYPAAAIAELNSKNENTLVALIYLKQYEEALTQGVGSYPELNAWLLGKTEQPMPAINIAFKNLEESGAKGNTMTNPDNVLLWQYSFPLLYNQQVDKYSRGTSIRDPLLMHALIREESRYNPYAVSKSNALGLCQLMPQTANAVAIGLGLHIASNTQLFQPDLNIKIGATYLSSLLNGFHGSSLLAIAAYNAGAGAVKAKLSDKKNFVVKDPDYFVEDFPYRETRDYIRKVISSYWLYRQTYYGS